MDVNSQKIKIVQCSPTLTESQVQQMGVFGRYAKGNKPAVKIEALSAAMVRSDGRMF